MAHIGDEPIVQEAQTTKSNPGLSFKLAPSKYGVKEFFEIIDEPVDTYDRAVYDGSLSLDLDSVTDSLDLKWVR